ncbi:alpha/beta hydrolase [Kibdelosporangium philippinense]|uniref:Alpha/beta hydrolase n=1 Tax=Kibdelosporangium philippinense TaxID=211113 RepID=A0ABS8ZR38_9PSEU|nr:alpha/beta hydrolase [Kibdelosporangium philippinense]MCE7010223.1 alpha/beta hydrolase [Kibdelosporangium philippinense]
MRRMLVATAVTALGLSIPTAAVATVDLSLPAPTGPYAVGRNTFALTDRGRADPWVPESGPRQLMVTMYYPAVPHTGGRSPYMDLTEATAFVDWAQLDPKFTASQLANTRTWSRTEAVPLPGRRPLVLLSPGFLFSRHTITALAEDLASRGYVTAAVDHAYESVGVRFPGGILPCTACELPGKIGHAPIALNRGTDLSFVLNELRGHPLVDQRHVAAVGHSMGGAGAATAMRADSRIDAGVNLDGPMLPSDPLDRPFLLIGTDENHEPGNVRDPSWDAVWPRMSGWKRWLHVTKSDHNIFTDLNLLVKQSGIEVDMPVEPVRGLRITRTYVAAFLDQHLRGVPQRLFTGPAAEFPEITFQRPPLG